MPYQVVGAGMILGGSGIVGAVLGYLAGSASTIPTAGLVLEFEWLLSTFPTDWNSYPIAWQFGGV
jgi:zinc transporter ZupT